VGVVRWTRTGADAVQLENESQVFEGSRIVTSFSDSTKPIAQGGCQSQSQSQSQSQREGAAKRLRC
jgi:hypothetical protein